MLVNYDSRVVRDWKIPHITTLELKFTIVNMFIRLATGQIFLFRFLDNLARYLDGLVVCFYVHPPVVDSIPKPYNRRPNKRPPNCDELNKNFTYCLSGSSSLARVWTFCCCFCLPFRQSGSAPRCGGPFRFMDTFTSPSQAASSSPSLSLVSWSIKKHVEGIGRVFLPRSRTPVVVLVNNLRSLFMSLES